MASLSSLMRSAGRASTPEKGLAAVAALREELEALERHHVATASAAGWSWSKVAAALGVSKQAAHKKHARMVRALAVSESARAAEPVEAVPGNERVTVAGEARQAVRFGRDEARSVGMTVVGTEHLLLGVLQADPESRAARALAEEGVTIDGARAGLAPTLTEEDQAVPVTSQATTEAARATGVSPLARECLEGALREAVRRGDRHLGLDHLLLALVSRDDGGAARTLVRLGTSSARVRRRLLEG